MRGWTLAFGIVAASACGAGAALGQATSLKTTPAPAVGPSVELAPGVIFQVVDLRRQPDKGFMELKFAVDNESPADTSLMDHGLAYNHMIKDISIIDYAGKMQFSIGFAGECLCSTFPDNDGGLVRSGERREFWAWYGLPGGGAKQVAIKLPDHPPIMNVALN